MKNKFLVYVLLLTSNLAYSQYFIERDRDTIKFRFCEIRSNGNGYSKNCSASTTRDSVIAMVIQIAHEKHIAIQKKPWLADWAAIDTLLYKSTGKIYTDCLLDAIKEQLIGNWDLIYEQDTIAITCLPDLSIKGGKIKGSFSSPEDNKTTIKGVFPSPVVLTITNNKLLGNLGGKNIIGNKR